MQRKILFQLFLFLLLLQGSVQAQNTFLWEITGNGLSQPSYLFGTYHLLKDEYLDKYPKVEEKLNKVQIIIVETDSDSASSMQAFMVEFMMKDEELSNLMSPADHQLVLNEIKKVLIGAPDEFINKIKPSALNALLAVHYSTLAAPEISRYNGTPMDKYFANEAKANGKQVIGLETTEEQLNQLLNHYTLQEQADQLAKLIRKDKEEILSTQRKLAETYLKPDLKKLLKRNKDYFEEYGDIAYILDDRNKRWIPAIENAIQQNSTFIAVGAAHLPGKNGVIKLLRKNGYKVRPVKE